MPDTILATVFDDDSSAHKGVTTLKKLHGDGDITLYAFAVLTKDASGKIEIKQTADEGPVGTALGTVIGGVVGLLGGPAGAILGMTGGGAIGALRDLYVGGVDAGFLSDVEQKLQPGKTVVIADVMEGWQVPVDDQMKAIGGTVFRKPRVEVVEEQQQRNVEALRAIWNEANAEADKARAEMKAELKAQAESIRNSLKRAGDQVKGRIKAMEDDANAGIKALNEQIERVPRERRAAFEKRVKEIESDLATRKAKLKEAARLAGEAFAA